MLILPYADLTLLSVNAVTQIVFASILSIVFLNEKWVMIYDLGSLIFITAGVITIVLLSNKEEQIYTAETIRALLFDVTTILYLTACCLIIILDYVLLHYMLQAVKDFELDVVNYDKK